MNEMDYYTEVCKKVELGELKPTQLLFSIKKLFSIPWLIAGDFLISQYPSDAQTS